MKLAINYSRAAARLLHSGKIEIDYFKTPEWDWIVNEALQIKPVAVHFTLEIGNDNLSQVDWGDIFRLREYTNTSYINFHLDARGSYYPEIPVDTINQVDIERVVNVIRSDLAIAIQKIGPDRIIIENCLSHGEVGNTMLLCVNPDLIRQLVEETGCGFLLDISHAVIASKTLGTDPYDYLSRLPVDSLKEMHFAGIQRNQVTGRWMDHLAICDEDWLVLDWVLQKIETRAWSAPWMLAFEYGGVGEPFEGRSDPRVIAEQVPRVFERVKRLKL